MQDNLVQPFFVCGNFPAMAHLTDAEGILLEVSDLWLENLGYQRPEVLGQSILVFLADERSLAAAGITGECRDLPCVFARKGGGVLEVFLSASWQRDDEGNVVRLQALLVDVGAESGVEGALRRSEEKFRSLFENSINAIFLGKANGEIMAANPAACEMFGMTEAELIRAGRSGIVDPSDERIDIALRERERTGRVFCEANFIRKNGTRFPAEVSSVISENGQDAYVTMRDITLRKAAEDALRESEERYRRLFEVESDAILVIDNETFAITDANAAAQRMYGYTLEELFALTAPELSAEPEKSRLSISSGEKFIPCRLHRRKDGSQFYVETGLSQFEYRRRRMSVVAIRDTTERVRAEKEQKAKIDLLNLCNSAETPLELMRDLADFFRKLADCEAVGVRLKEGEDFPYFVTLGFPLEFILAENSLCAEDIQGHPVFDSAGKPVLECLCGAILNGGVDPSHHFTKNGSFYSNNTAELPADMPGMLLPATRNRCHAEGYLSVALIPLRSQGEAYGLFQFNDRRCGRFSGRTIKYLEDLVNYVAIALAKLIADQSLKRSELALRQAQNLAMLGSYTYDVAADRWSGSEMLGKILGLEKPQGNAAGFAKLLHPLDREEVLAGMAESIALGRRFSHEFRVFRADDGKERWMHDLGDVEYGPHGGPLRIVGIIQDITDRKAAEEKLRGYARRLIELEEDTRRKLATNLHDSIGPDIAVLGINNAMVREKLSPESAGNLGETLDESGRLIESISRKVRSITGELRPPVLDDFGLPASLRWYAELYFKRTGVNVDMQIDEACTTLSGDQELALFRIAQEALNNSAKHAAARNVALSLMYADGAVVLTIADDGTGFIPAKGTDLQSACHWGLILMRERAELFGGKFFLDSAPGTGTTVRVELKGER